MKRNLFLTKPKPYQKQGIKKLIDMGRALLADDMGLGKTLQSLYAAIPLRRKKPIIVVCPASVKYGWEEEVKQHTGMRSWVLEGRKPLPRLPLYVPPVVIINWDILQNWDKFLSKLNPQVVIADESQFAKSHKAARTKALKRLCKNVPFVFCLTGTPIENRPSELFTALHLLRPDIFDSWYSFANRYCGPKHTYWGTTYDGATNIDELRQILVDHVMIRRRREEVLPELPPVTPHLVPLQINLEEYQAAEEDIRLWLIRRGLAFSGKINALALTKMTHLLKLVAQLKLNNAIDWIRTFLETTDEKLVVFGFHRSILEHVYQEFYEEAVLVYGGVSGRKRQASIDEFATNPSKRLFIGNILAAGTGINKLQRVSCNACFLEFIWTPTKISQAIGRLNRLGQTRAVTVHYLVAYGTIEHKLCRALQKKQAIIDQTIDGTLDESEFDVLTPLVMDLTKRKRTDV